MFVLQVYNWWQGEGVGSLYCLLQFSILHFTEAWQLIYHWILDLTDTLTVKKSWKIGVKLDKLISAKRSLQGNLHIFTKPRGDQNPTKNINFFFWTSSFGNQLLQSKSVIVFDLPSFNLDTGWTAATWADTTEYEYCTSTSSVFCILSKHFVY